MTAGHLFLKETFGEDYVPTVGWQIDPFGVCCHFSNFFTSSSIVKVTRGHTRNSDSIGMYNNFPPLFNYIKVVMRIDYQDIDYRRANQQMEFVWRPMNSFDSEDQDILSYVLYNGIPSVL